MSYSDTISYAQANFIRSLLSERLATLGMSTVDEAAAAINLSSLSKGDASTLITRLKAMAKDPDPTMPEVVGRSQRYGKGNRPGTCASCLHPVGKDAGWYYLASAGRWAVHHNAGACPTGPAPQRVEVTEGLYGYNGQVILVYRTHNGRLAGKVHTGRSFRYQQGAVNLAAMGQRLTAAEAAAWGHAHGNCVACAKDLTDDRSITVGYGPVCAKRYGWPWG